MKRLLCMLILAAALILAAGVLPTNATPTKSHRVPRKVTSADSRYKRAMAAFARDDIKEGKREARLNARIPKKRRQIIYYQLQQALTDNILKNKSMTGDPYMKAVCRKNHISDDDGDIIRTEGDKQGWPQPEM